MKNSFTFAEFLKKDKTELSTIANVCFTSKAPFPLLFFSRVIMHLKKTQDTPLHIVDISSTSKQELIANLETSFLGAKTIYWLRDLSSVSAREQTFWYDYCARYVGPNSIWYFLPEDKKMGTVSTQVLLPESLDASLFTHLCAFFGVTHSMEHAQFIHKLFKERSAIDLDMACVLIEYMHCTGKDDSFFNDMVPLLLPSEESLFALSTAFLGKKSDLFYAQWHQLSTHYSEQFWCSFFSDLLWRSAQYIRLARENDMIAARKIAYRLPFSFVKNDWRNLKQKDLIKAHAFIYDIDFRLKNSGGYGAFDLFFSSFFLGAF